LTKRTALALLFFLPPFASAAGLDGLLREVLPNGLVVLVLPEPGSPFVSVGTMYRVGSRNEAAGTTGLAHYCEHMNFRATRRFPGHETTESITRRGGRWSGYTWIDQTWYRSTMEKDALDHLLALEADRMTEALYEPAAFGQERTSVLAELRSYDDPHSLLYDAVLAASFEIHPYRNNTIGYPSDVEGVTRDEAYRFYRRFYHPNNAVLSVASGLPAEEVLSRVRDRFGALPGNGETTAVRTVEPAQTGQRRVTVRKPGPHAQLLVAFRAPALLDADFPTMVLLDALLAGGKGFRLLEKYPAPGGTPLDEALRGLVTDGSTAWQASPYPYVYTLSASVPGEEGLERSESAYFRLLERAAKREWTEAERLEAVGQVRRGWARDLDEQGERIHQLAFFEIAGSWRELLDLPERLQQVTTADLQRFVRERLRPEQATVGWFVPAPEAPSFPEPTSPRPNPSEAIPSAPKAFSVSVPEPARSFALPSGVSLTVAPAPGTSLVAVRGRIPIGPAPEGVLAVVVEHLNEPRPGEDATVPALSWTLLDDPEAAVNAQAIELTASGLAEDVPGLLRILAGRLQAPLPAGADWERLRAAARQRAEERAATLSTALLARARAELHPASSRHGRPPWGSPDAVSVIRRDDAARFLRELGSLRLVVTGAVAPEDVRRAAEVLPQGEARAAITSLSPARGPATWIEIRLPWPGAAQNELLVVWPGDRSKRHDRAATAALLYLLGETHYSGRLGRAVVEPGIVYSVNTTLEDGLLVVRTAVASKDTAEALRRIRAVLEDVARGALAEADLAEAKAYLRGKAARGREGALATAATLVEGEPGTAEGLTLAQLNDTARRLFRNGAPLALVGGPGY
jgi:zinc protease